MIQIFYYYLLKYLCFKNAKHVNIENMARNTCWSLLSENTELSQQISEDDMFKQHVLSNTKKVLFFGQESTIV